MARRRFIRRVNGQYGWATSVGIPPQAVPVNAEETVSTIIVLGSTDVDVGSAGNKHANLRRVVGDIVLHPFFEAQSTVTNDDPGGSLVQVAWMMALVDADDVTEYSPWDPVSLAEERIVAHGILSASMMRTEMAANFFGFPVVSHTQERVDVKSNRRIVGNENLAMFFNAEGSTTANSTYDNVGLVTWSLRALLWFP